LPYTVGHLLRHGVPMQQSLQDVAVALQKHAAALGVRNPTNQDFCSLCASCAFLAYVECGGTDLGGFNWEDGHYQEVAYRILFEQLRGRTSDLYDANRRERLRANAVGIPCCSAWTARTSVDTDALEARDLVDLLRRRLRPRDFRILEALYLEGMSIREYAPIWAASENYRGRTSLQHAENALSKRFRRVLATAKHCLECQ
jgi:hypothetical protein